MYKTLISGSQRVSSVLLKKLTVVTLIFWGAIGLFITVADEVLERQPIGIDHWALTTVHSFHQPWLDQVVIWLTGLGSAVFIAIITTILALTLVYYKRIRLALFIALASGGAAIMNYVLKALFQRDRPDLWQALVVERSYSFPSGHAMASSALAFGIMALLWNTRWRWLAILLGSLLIVVVGFTRIYLGVHYPSDVVAGWCVSFAWVVVVRQLLLKPHAS